MPWNLTEIDRDLTETFKIFELTTFESIAGDKDSNSTENFGKWDSDSPFQLLNLIISGSYLEKYLFCLELVHRTYHFRFKLYRQRNFLWSILFFQPTGIEFEIQINALDNEKPVFSTTRLLSLEPEKIITRIIYTLVITELRFGLDHRFTGPDNRFHALRSKFSYHSSLATPLPLKRSSFQPFHMLNALAHAEKGWGRLSSKRSSPHHQRTPSKIDPHPVVHPYFLLFSANNQFTIEKVAAIFITFYMTKNLI